MDSLRVGRAVRALRRRRGWTQSDVAVRAGTSAATVSRIEAGQFLRKPFATMLAIAAVLEIQLELLARWKAEGLDRLLDAAHAELVEALVARYRAADWEVAVEVSFAIGGERGSIDVLAFHPAARLVAVNEVKSVVPDAQATIHPHDRKARLGLAIAAERGWRGSRVVRVLAIGESRTSRRRIERLTGVFGAAYPLQGRAILAWIDDPAAQIEIERSNGPPDLRGAPSTLLSGLFFLSPLHATKGATRVDSRHRVRARRAA
jgi:transcriptional regulator with XRE-family HTH domain